MMFRKRFVFCCLFFFYSQKEQQPKRKRRCCFILSDVLILLSFYLNKLGSVSAVVLTEIHCMFFLDVERTSREFYSIEISFKDPQGQRHTVLRRMESFSVCLYWCNGERPWTLGSAVEVNLPQRRDLSHVQLETLGSHMVEVFIWHARYSVQSPYQTGDKWIICTMAKAGPTLSSDGSGCGVWSRLWVGDQRHHSSQSVIGLL